MSIDTLSITRDMIVPDTKRPNVPNVQLLGPTLPASVRLPPTKHVVVPVGVDFVVDDTLINQNLRKESPQIPSGQIGLNYNRSY